MMKSLKTSIQIQAPAAIVWNSLIDFEQYPEWNPFIRQIKGEAVQGQNLQISIQIPGQKPSEFKPEVIKCVPAQELRWLGKLFFKGLFDGEHYFQLKVIGPNKVEFIHGENFSGLLSSPLMALIGKSTKEGFEAMNKALKAEAESKFQNHAS